MLVVNSLCKNIFLIFFSKFPVFSLSGKMDFQIPCFPCAVATLHNGQSQLHPPSPNMCRPRVTAPSLGGGYYLYLTMCTIHAILWVSTPLSRPGWWMYLPLGWCTEHALLWVSTPPSRPGWWMYLPLGGCTAHALLLRSHAGERRCRLVQGARH